MKLNNLKISNFRSYDFLDLDFIDGTNIITGKNAQGKTNIIEAINYFSTLKSHRYALDKELIKTGFDKGEMKIEFFSGRSCESKISLYKNAKREIIKNGVKCDNASFLGSFNSVIFSPEDLNLIKGEKDNRRKFLDTDICQLRPKYYKILKNYNYFLKNRNKLLKEENDKSLLSVYTEKMVEFGVEVLIYRFLFIERLKETAKKIYSEISGNGDERLEIFYSSSILKEITNDKKLIKERYITLLDEKKKEEEALKTTVIGPHRDDVEFFINAKSAKVYSSQGQMRTIILALKLSELIFMKEFSGGSYPVLLLDDILSELDRERQEKLFSYIKNCQTIITITDAQSFDVKNSKIIKVPII